MTVLKFKLSRPSRALKRSSVDLPRLTAVPDAGETPASAWRNPVDVPVNRLSLPHHRHPLPLSEQIMAAITIALFLGLCLWGLL